MKARAPMAQIEKLDSTHFREVLGHLPTGVTVITANGRQGPVGMAANSVTSLSLEPALILFCPARSSTTWPLLREAKRWCVNVMAGHHEELTRQFAIKDHDRFAGVRYSDRPFGPGLDDAVAWIECELYEEHDGGDHTIVVSRVVAIEAAAEVQPLVFFRGSYGTFSRRERD
jgi:3-hydroxy-9,10-secoandrosta-1,3,5(10)-triene-9,17-dione monooxygenase reductase component